MAHQQHLVGRLACIAFCCFAIVPTLLEAERDSHKLYNLEEIKSTVKALIDSSVHISLEEHLIRYVKGERHTRKIEKYRFLIDDGRVIILSTEQSIDNDQKPKVVSNVDITDDDVAQKVLLSLVGSGHVKSLVVQKPKKNVTV